VRLVSGKYGYHGNYQQDVEICMVTAERHRG
jgi:hypothetical protein